MLNYLDILKQSEKPIGDEIAVTSSSVVTDSSDLHLANIINSAVKRDLNRSAAKLRDTPVTLPAPLDKHQEVVAEEYENIGDNEQTIQTPEVVIEDANIQIANIINSAINKNTGKKFVKRKILENIRRISPDQVQEYLAQFKDDEDEEAPPLGDNVVASPDNTGLPDKNVTILGRQIGALQTEVSQMRKGGVWGSGGGTNAVQYRDGGTMYGPLIIASTLSAQSYLGVGAGDVTASWLPLSGGTLTGDVLGVSFSASNDITAHYYDFIVDGNPGWREGRLYYDAQDHTLALYTDVQDTALQIGQEQWVRITNKTGQLIPNGTPVYINGAQGNRPTVALASAHTDATANVIGLATHDIAINAIGLITQHGIVRDIDTSDWVEGTTLYLSMTSGILTDCKCLPPSHPAEVGTVIYQHNNNGAIFVAIDKGNDLNELHDVIDSPDDGDSLIWNASLSAWESRSGSTVPRVVQNYTTSHTALSTNSVMSFALTAGAVLTLPDIATYGSIEYVIKNKVRSTATLTVSGAQLIDGLSSQPVSPGNALCIVPDNDEWIII